MKKIFLMFVAVCALFACDPTHEKISNDGHITIDELKAKTVVTVDKAASGANGNVISCQTLAPVNAKWSIGDKEFFANAAKKKMKLGTHEVILTALCADGTVLTSSYQVDCQEITDPLQKFYIFGSADNTEPAILGPGDAAAGRFSDGEGKYFPFLSDDVYLGKKTLIFDIIDAQDGKFIWGDDYGCTVRVMSGWWDGPFADNVPLSVGLWELPITDEIAEVCAKGKTAHDLDLMMTRGTVKIKSVYYEE
jgi:hypothetical protein